MDKEILKTNLDVLENDRTNLKNKILNQLSKDRIDSNTLLDLIIIDVKIKVIKQVL